MNSDVSWWMWVVGGMVTGGLPMLGDSRILGLLQTVAVIGSPFFIFFTAGAKLMPFVFFYGGLIVVSSFVFKRRTAKEDIGRKAALAEKKKNWS